MIEKATSSGPVLHETAANRVYGLDVLRALAIIFVLIGHTLEHSRIAQPVQTLGHLGITGVELFFVLSGFLIGSIIMRLIDQGEFHTIAQIANFWRRRWFRTLPLYFICLLAFLRFDYHGRHSLLEFPLYFVFMQNFAYRIPTFFELSWSLAIEEHFYFWFPLVFLGWLRLVGKSSRAILVSALTFILIAYSFRVLQPTETTWTDYNLDVRLTVLSRADAIMFGVLMAAMKFVCPAWFEFARRAMPLTATLFVLLCVWWFADAPFLMQSRMFQINLFTIQAALAALLLPYFDSITRPNGASAFFSVTSRLSYSLYLMHILVIIAVNTALNRLGIFESVYTNPFIIYPIYISLYYFASWVSYHLVEKPMQDLRDQVISIRSATRAAWPTVLIAVALVFVF